MPEVKAFIDSENKSAVKSELDSVLAENRLIEFLKKINSKTTGRPGVHLTFVVEEDMPFGLFIYRMNMGGLADLVIEIVRSCLENVYFEDEKSARRMVTTAVKTTCQRIMGCLQKNSFTG